MREQLLRNDVPSYAACCDAVANVDWLDELPRIECPTLVLAGVHDIGAPPAMAQEVHERIAGSQIQVFDQASHLSPVEQPDAFRTAVRRFISMLETDQGSQVDAM